MLDSNDDVIGKYHLPWDPSLQSYLFILNEQINKAGFAEYTRSPLNVLEPIILKSIERINSTDNGNTSIVGDGDHVNLKLSLVDFMNDMIIQQIIGQLSDTDENSTLGIDYNLESLDSTKNTALALYYFYVINHADNVMDYLKRIIDQKFVFLTKNMKSILNGKKSLNGLKEAVGSDNIDMKVWAIHLSDILSYIIDEILTFDSFMKFCIKQEPERLDNYILLQNENFYISDEFIKQYFNQIVTKDVFYWNILLELQAYVAELYKIKKGEDSEYDSDNI